jgi:hypothetical protein
MACTVDSVNGGLQASGLCRETDPIKLLQLTAQALANRLLVLFPGTNVTPEAILVRACASGIGKIQDPTLLQKAFAQSVCNGFPPPIPPDPYNGLLVYTRQGLGTTTVVNPTGVFNLTFGANQVTEVHCHNCPNITGMTLNNSLVLTLVDFVNCPGMRAWTMNGCNVLTTLNLDFLLIGNTLSVQNNTALTTLSVNGMTSASDIQITGCPITSIAFPLLVTSTIRIFCYAMPQLASLSMPLLQSSAAISVRTNAQITAYSFLTSSIFTSLTTFPTGYLGDVVPLLPALNFPALTALVSSLNAFQNTALTTVTIGVSNIANGAFIQLASCALNQATVDLILQRAVNNAGMITGSIILNAGTSSVPSATGLTNKATLIGRGVTVNTN